MSHAAASELQWHGEFGFLKANPNGVYNHDYFAKYQGYAATELGRRINTARLHLVDQWVWSEKLVIDVGIGCGQFVESRPGTFGYDVNPAGVNWLRERGLFLDPYTAQPDVLTLWDVLEHLEDPRALVDRAREMVILSIPIFLDRAHVLRSRHFRPDEHFWYFTRRGLIEFMAVSGFALAESNQMETVLGREDIHSFVFRRYR